MSDAAIQRLMDQADLAAHTIERLREEVVRQADTVARLERVSDGWKDLAEKAEAELAEARATIAAVQE